MTDRESEAWRDAIEVMRAERDRHEMYGHVRTEGYCTCGHPKDGPFYTRVEWERHVEDCVLSALLAPSRVTCTTCSGKRTVSRQVEQPFGGLLDRHCHDCSDGTVEGPPVIYRVLGMEQVGWAKKIESWPAAWSVGPMNDVHTDKEPVYRLSDTRGPK